MKCPNCVEEMIKGSIESFGVTSSMNYTYSMTSFISDDAIMKNVFNRPVSLEIPLEDDVAADYCGKCGRVYVVYEADVLEEDD